MSTKQLNDKIIFGLKVRQLRQEQKLSFAAFSNATGMSVSYLNEIEKGKKYPKDDKIAILAAALNVPASVLTSTKLPRSLAPVEDLLQSNFLQELPLDLFGVELPKVVEMIANAPSKVGAFIATLVDLSRNYALAEENFYFGALRSYLEMHNNYFGELEDQVDAFVKLHHLPTGMAIHQNTLRRILEDEYDYNVLPEGLKDYPELSALRALFVPKSRSFLLNQNLSNAQQCFQLGKELGFNFLQLKDRALTSSLLKVENFEQVLSHFKAGYFSAALLINRQSFIEDLKHFFASPRWDADWLPSLLKKYDATPEMLIQRMTNLLPEYFGVEDIFILRFVHKPSTGAMKMDKELHLNRRHRPHSNALKEHYCRRWLSFSLMRDFKEDETFKIGIQHSKYLQTEDNYLCITMATTVAEDRMVSVTLGILQNEQSRQVIQFSNDPVIPEKTVHTTCERCPLKDCAVRAADPIVVREKEKFKKVMNRVESLMKD
ncbi:MAG: helix-turn-helix domain-containing protein [Saprospiraceae bacterium]|nr:helix-turn-helix domain-containing protein [Saprospiraceae bacterium]